MNKRQQKKIKKKTEYIDLVISSLKHSLELYIWSKITMLQKEYYDGLRHGIPFKERSNTYEGT